MLGFLGLGDMGVAMALRLLDAGHDQLRLWNRSPDKALPLLSRGALLDEHPRQVLERCSIVGICLSDQAAVRSICEGPDGLFAAGTAEPKVIVDFSTGAPEAARDLAVQAKRRGLHWLDAPVSGGVPAAREGRLVIFAGGESVAFEAAAPLLLPLACAAHHVGPSGSGQALKLCNQLIVACNLLTIAEAIALGRSAGVDVNRLPAALKGGFADSAPLQVFGPRMAQHVFEPRLGALRLMAKDVALTAAMAGNAAGPMLRLAQRIYEDALDSGSLPSEGDISQLVRLYDPHTDPGDGWRPPSSTPA
jgi:3-hydroxyisobutyrate dehydrogenase